MSHFLQDHFVPNPSGAPSEKHSVWHTYAVTFCLFLASNFWNYFFFSSQNYCCRTRGPKFVSRRPILAGSFHSCECFNFPWISENQIFFAMISSLCIVEIIFLAGRICSTWNDDMNFVAANSHIIIKTIVFQCDCLITTTPTTDAVTTTITVAATIPAFEFL